MENASTVSFSKTQTVIAPKLSILVCSIMNRLESLGKIMYALRNQSENKPVEVISVLDNSSMRVGEKRNRLLSMAKGDYVCFVDDDDFVSVDYVDSILEAMEENPDVITFGLARNHNGVFDRHCYYSIEFDRDRDTKEAYYRIPNHLMVFKREIAQSVKYKNVSFGEDAEWAKLVKPLLKTEKVIPKILYLYESNDQLSETRKHYKISVIIAHPTIAALRSFSEYVQGLDAVGEIIAVSNEALHEMMPGVTRIVSDSYTSTISAWNNTISSAKYEKVCFLDGNSVLDRYAFHYASLQLENEEISTIGLDDECLISRQTTSRLEKCEQVSIGYRKALFLKKENFKHIPENEDPHEWIFSQNLNKNYRLIGPQIFTI